VSPRLVAIARISHHWPLIAVLLAFAAAAFVVPTLTPIATTDDWGYSRSVEILYYQGELKIFPVVAASAVFQVIWGYLFAVIFGMTLGVMRLSSIVMTALGAIALYTLLREVGITRSRSALGVAAYLFNPLTFILAYTFMTDPHFTALLLIATALYVRGLRNDHSAPLSLYLGSIAAACAFLVRQQGSLIPLAVIVFLLLTGRLRPNRTGILTFLRVVAVPTAATVSYVLWLRFLNNVPDVQQGFLDEAKASGLAGAWTLTRHLTFIELIYLGFFTLPIVAAAVPGLRRIIATLRPGGWLLFAVWEAILVAGLAIYGLQGKRLPYIGQFVGTGGLGPPDVLGSRPRLLDAPLRDQITVITAIAAFLFALMICRLIGTIATRERAQVGLVVVIAVWQIVGVLPPSFHYLRRGYSLDRYLLPLLPLAIVLLLWAIRDLRLFQPVAWLLVAGYAVIAIAGTRDYLVYLDTAWSIGHKANALGIPNDKLDAGSGWDGYHLYTYSLDNNITKSRTQNGPWWVYFYAKATDSTFIVTAQPPHNTIIITKQTYTSWLSGDTSTLYLVRTRPFP
jgi:4-amino-4-deoxy-L-arabinose transferase-like glycosyltransferase